MTITHPDRVVYPDAGVTKGEIAAYYDAVAERMAPHLRERPLSIVRAPETIAETFFQRHPLRGMETGIIPVDVDGETYMALDGAGRPAHRGAVRRHRTARLDEPDRARSRRPTAWCSISIPTRGCRSTRSSARRPTSPRRSQSSA